MPRRNKEETFRIICGVLALVEEREEPVPLADAAALAGVTPDELRDMLEPVLYQEFATPSGTVVGHTDAFLLDEHDRLRLESEHWLRDLASEPPDTDTALRLYVAGTVMQSISAEPTPTLDRALKKLEPRVAENMIVALNAPPFLGIARRAHSLGRTVLCRYANDKGEVSDREIEPWLVFSNWGRWYVHGRDLGDDRVKWFRVDRMASAKLGENRFTPPPDVEIPEWFDLPDEAPLIVRLTPEEVDNLPTPRRIESTKALPDGRVEVSVVVHGKQRLEHLLVVLPPDAEIVGPPEYREIRRQHAERLLALYE